MDCKKVGSFIQSLRKEKGWTQQVLADQIGVSDKAVSKWERGAGCPDITLISDLAKALGVSVSEILAGTRIQTVTRETIEDITMDTVAGYTERAKKNMFLKMGIVVLILAIALAAVSIVFYTTKTALPTTDERLTDFETSMNQYLTDVKVFATTSSADSYYDMVESQTKTAASIDALLNCYKMDTRKYKKLHFFRYRFNQFTERVRIDVEARGSQLGIKPAKKKKFDSSYGLMRDYYQMEWCNSLGRH